MTTSLLTAEEFEECKFDLPEGGRWVELVRGEVVIHDPPSEVHGNVVLNLSKLLADHIQTRLPEQPGYACFETGIVVARNPDTVRCPAVSFFTAGSCFEATDRPVTELVPEVVIEIVSTNSRRQEMTRRVGEYHAFAAEHVWIIDPVDEVVHVCRRGESASIVAATQVLFGDPVFPGLSVTASDLFAAPDWWDSSGKK